MTSFDDIIYVLKNNSNYLFPYREQGHYSGSQ